MKILTAWLPLLVGTLLFLRGCAALLGPNPRSVRGESPYFEKVTQSKGHMVGFTLGVAVFMSLVLAVIAYVFTMLLNIDFDRWAEILLRGLAVVLGCVYAAALSYMLGRLFSHKIFRWSVPVIITAIILAWAIWPNWLTTDLFAVLLIATGLAAYLEVTLNFMIVALAGFGLVIYDIVNVYFTGTMMRVAAPMMEAGIPGMIVVPQNWALDSAPAAGLGAGDVVFPGLMIMLAAVLSYRCNDKSLLYGGLIGYAVGLVLVFGILYVTRLGQPALITLYPCVLIGILIAARRAGRLRELFSMRHIKKSHLHGRDCSCEQDCEAA